MHLHKNSVKYSQVAELKLFVNQWKDKTAPVIATRENSDQKVYQGFVGFHSAITW